MRLEPGADLLVFPLSAVASLTWRNPQRVAPPCAHLGPGARRGAKLQKARKGMSNIHFARFQRGSVHGPGCENAPGHRGEHARARPTAESLRGRLCHPTPESHERGPITDEKVANQGGGRQRTVVANAARTPRLSVGVPLGERPARPKRRARRRESRCPPTRSAAGRAILRRQSLLRSMPNSRGVPFSGLPGWIPVIGLGRALRNRQAPPLSASNRLGDVDDLADVITRVSQ